MSDQPTLYGLLNQFEAIGGPELYGPEGIAIILALWRKSNKLNWNRSFSMTNTELHAQTGISSRDTINRYRKKLMDGGLINYTPPPRGKSRGDYVLNFNFINVEPVLETDNFNDNSDKVAAEVVREMDNSQKVVGKVVQNTDTVLNQITSSSSSPSDSDNIAHGNFGKLSEQEINQLAKEVENHFIMKRQSGLELNSDDVIAIRQVVVDGIPLEIIKNTIDTKFATYKPKHRLDRIRTFTYCAPSIYDAWMKQKAITEPLAPVALGSSITENVPSEPVALGGYQKRQYRKQQGFSGKPKIAVSKPDNSTAPTPEEIEEMLKLARKLDEKFG